MFESESNSVKLMVHAFIVSLSEINSENIELNCILLPILDDCVVTKYTNSINETHVRLFFKRVSMR